MIRSLTLSAALVTLSFSAAVAGDPTPGAVEKAREATGPPESRLKCRCPGGAHDHAIPQGMPKVTPSNSGGAKAEPEPPLAAPAKPKTETATGSKTKRPRIEVVFVVDTTGSMGGLIEGAKKRVWSIANEILGGNPRPDVSIGLVAYRDKGDAYVTQVTQPTEDLDSIYRSLQGFRAGGGGDGPEHVNKGLHDAFHVIKWNKGSDLRLVYLVGDAPPHRDYDKQIDYAEIVPVAHKKGIVVNTVLCGNSSSARTDFQAIARLGGGEFFQIDQSGGMTAIRTPHDDKLLELQKKLDGTRVSYGSTRERKEDDSATAEALDMAGEAGAHRAAAKAKMAPSRYYSRRDLVQAFKDGKLGEVKTEELPEALRKLEPKELKAKLKELAETRTKLQAELATLAKKRDAWLKANAPKDGFDAKVMEALKPQAKKIGVIYK